MNKKARISVAIIATTILVAVIAVLVVLNWKWGAEPDPLAIEAAQSTTQAVGNAEPEPEESPSQVSTQAQSTASGGDSTHSSADNYGNTSVQTIRINPDQWYLTLVSKKYKLPDDFTVQTSYLIENNQAELDSRCADQYIAMYNAAKEDHCTLTPFSGWRRISTQKKNYENKIAYFQQQGYSYQAAADKAATIILPPGTSEHNLGLAMDIVCAEEWFADTKEFQWLMEHAQDYGFILRYPADKQDITGITYEPWHWRYVGVDAAKAMKASGQCLEEYLGKA